MFFQLICTTFQSDHNRKQIKLLYQQNKAQKVINILEKTVSELYNDYCNDIETEGFQTLKNELERLHEEMIDDEEENIEEYLKEYERVAKNLEKIFENKRSRNNKI